MMTETNPNELLAQRLRDVGVRCGVTLSDSRPGNGTRVVIPGGTRVEWVNDRYVVRSGERGLREFRTDDAEAAVAHILSIENGGR